jgi:ligand-binding sensor domain-containing protein
MKKTILVIYLLLSVLLTYGESTNFQFRHYSVENGLSSNAVRSMIQDKNGFIWFGTDEGLNRYDGITIKKYRYNNNLMDQYVCCLYDSGDHIWVGTYRGVYLYDYVTESFTGRPYMGGYIPGRISLRLCDGVVYPVERPNTQPCRNQDQRQSYNK